MTSIAAASSPKLLHCDSPPLIPEVSAPRRRLPLLHHRSRPSRASPSPFLSASRETGFWRLRGLRTCFSFCCWTHTLQGTLKGTPRTRGALHLGLESGLSRHLNIIRQGRRVCNRILFMSPVVATSRKKLVPRPFSSAFVMFWQMRICVSGGTRMVPVI